MSSIAGFEAPRRRAYFEDVDGVPATCKRPDEVLSWYHDWSSALGDGELISTVTYEPSGVTISGEGNTLDRVVCNIEGCGELKVTVVTSFGLTHERVFRFYPSSGFSTSDYE